jgi:hypothetical protein
MARRKQTARVNCASAGCREVAWYEYDSLREADKAARDRQKHPYRCYRHSDPDEVLSADNPKTEVVLIASKVRTVSYERDLAEYHAAVARNSNYASKPKEFIDGLYWLEVGGSGHGSGVTHGDGYRAIAKDFPEGTRLVVSARIEYPSEVLNGPVADTKRPRSHEPPSYHDGPEGEAP